MEVEQDNMYTSNYPEDTLLSKLIFALSVIVQAGTIAKLFLQVLEKVGGTSNEQGQAKSTR